MIEISPLLFIKKGIYIYIYNYDRIYTRNKNEDKYTKENYRKAYLQSEAEGGDLEKEGYTIFVFLGFMVMYRVCGIYYESRRIRLLA